LRKIDTQEYAQFIFDNLLMCLAYKNDPGVEGKTENISNEQSREEESSRLNLQA